MIKVYGVHGSPFVRKVIAFAAEKGIEVEVQAAGFGRGGDGYLNGSPLRNRSANAVFRR